MAFSRGHEVVIRGAMDESAIVCRETFYGQPNGPVPEHDSVLSGYVVCGY